MSYSYSSGDETDISESELQDYVDEIYQKLKDGKPKVKFSDDVYRCPYCPGKKKFVYQFKDLLQHSIDVGKGSQNKDIKHKGKHLSLVKYMQSTLNSDDLSSELTILSLETPAVDDKFVYPWIGILANVVTGSTGIIKNDLTKKGFAPVRIRLLGNDNFAVVEFKKNWSGFYNALMFEKEFEVNGCGKKDYYSGEQKKSDDWIFGWVARDDDFKSEGVLGNGYIQKIGDLKTIADIEGDEKRKTNILIDDLSNTTAELRMCVDELESKINEASV